MAKAVTPSAVGLQDALLECVRKKVPVLLSRGMARLVVIDSVAAPFRCEFDSAASVPRARRLQALGGALRWLSCTFRTPVLCINQVGVLAGTPDRRRPHPPFRGDAGGEAVGSSRQLTPVCMFQVTEGTEEQGTAPGLQG